MSDPYLEILKSKLNDTLGITKFTQGLQKKLKMIEGANYTQQGFNDVQAGMKEVINTGATLMKTLKDSGMSEAEATKQVKKYTGQLKDAAMMASEAKFPGYQQAVDIELHKKSGIDGIFKQTATKKPRKATTKTSTKKAISDAKKAEKKAKKAENDAKKAEKKAEKKIKAANKKASKKK